MRKRFARLAIDNDGNTFTALAVRFQQQRWRVSYCQQFTLDNAPQVSLPTQSLMAALDHRATHYQSLAASASLNSVQEHMANTLGNPEALAVDFQNQPHQTIAVAGHHSQVAQKQQQLAAFKRPVSIIEPAFQSVLRAINALLPQLCAAHALTMPLTDWYVLQLAEPLAIQMHCRYGELHALSFLSISDVVEQPPRYPMFYFGSANHCQRLITDNAHHRLLPVTLDTIDNSSSVTLTSDKHLVLFGLALRGANQWHL